MPTVQVRVNTINPDAKQGDYDAVEITGFDQTNNRGFKKKFFSTKKGTSIATKAAEAAYGLNKDDWCEITMDDSTYQNVQSIRKIDPPSGAAAPPAGSGGGSRPTSSAGASGSDKMTKAEWAEKDAKKDAAIARNSALKSAVELMKVVGKIKGKDTVKLVLDVAGRFEEYLNPPSREPGDEEPETPGRTTSPSGTTLDTTQTEGPVNPPVEEDDDIPF